MGAAVAVAGETSVVWKGNGRQPVQVRVAPEGRRAAARDAKPGLSGQARELLAMWGVKDAEGELSERLREADFLGREHVRYRQVYKGLEVDGRELIVHWKDGAVYEVNGDFLEGVEVGTVPSVGAKEAVAAASGGVAGGAAVRFELDFGTAGAYGLWAAEKGIAGAWDAVDADGIANVFRYVFDVAEGADGLRILGVTFDEQGRAVVQTPPVANSVGFELFIATADDPGGTKNPASHPLNTDGETVIDEPETGSRSRFYRLKATLSE